MRHILLSDHPGTASGLLPLTFTRPVSELRPGILTIRERYAAMLPDVAVSVICSDMLMPKYGHTADDIADAIVIDSAVYPTWPLVQALETLGDGQRLITDSGRELARRGKGDHDLIYDGKVIIFDKLYDLFGFCGDCVEQDFDLLTAGNLSQPLSPSNTLIGPEDRLFIAPGAVVEGAVINTRSGCVYIGTGAEVMEGACLRGPVAVGNGSVIKMGAKIYGASAFGPQCRIGGEVSNVVMFGYSNKGHDGFLGNAVIGEWCNIGAGCSASNLKNDYSEIKLWNYPTRRFLRTGLIHCGPVMADHSKAGVNTMLNTATVLGVGVNLHGSGFPRNFVASFMEGSASGFGEMPLRKFLDTARRMMARRNVEMTEIDEQLYSAIYAATQENRG